MIDPWVLSAPAIVADRPRLQKGRPMTNEEPAAAPQPAAPRPTEERTLEAERRSGAGASRACFSFGSKDSGANRALELKAQRAGPYQPSASALGRQAPHAIFERQRRGVIDRSALQASDRVRPCFPILSDGAGMGRPFGPRSDPRLHGMTTRAAMRFGADRVDGRSVAPPRRIHSQN